MYITGFIAPTAGGRHAWYETNAGIKIRKPLGVVKNFYREPEQPVAKVAAKETKPTLWQRILAWLRAALRTR